LSATRFSGAHHRWTHCGKQSIGSKAPRTMKAASIRRSGPPDRHMPSQVSPLTKGKYNELALSWNRRDLRDRRRNQRRKSEGVHASWVDGGHPRKWRDRHLLPQPGASHLRCGRRLRNLDVCLWRRDRHPRRVVLRPETEPEKGSRDRPRYRGGHWLAPQRRSLTGRCTELHSSKSHSD